MAFFHSASPKLALGELKLCIQTCIIISQHQKKVQLKRLQIKILGGSCYTLGGGPQSPPSFFWWRGTKGLLIFLGWAKVCCIFFGGGCSKGLLIFGRGPKMPPYFSGGECKAPPPFLWGGDQKGFRHFFRGGGPRDTAGKCRIVQRVGLFTITYDLK